MRPLDLLDVTAREHRALHRALDLCVDDEQPAALEHITAVTLDLLRHEAMERVVLYPLLERDDGGPVAVLERREEQRSIASLVARSVEPPAETDVVVVLRELRMAVIGHTDREELEDFPRVRRCTSVEELRALGKHRRAIARRLAEVTLLPGELSIPENGDGPIGRLERVALDILQSAEPTATRQR